MTTPASLAEMFRDKVKPYTTPGTTPYFIDEAVARVIEAAEIVMGPRSAHLTNGRAELDKALSELRGALEK